jgi:hypothetical protein
MKIFLCAHRNPDNLVGYARIPMNQAIPEGDDQGGIRDPLLQIRFPPEELIECFTDDLKLPLHCGPEHGVGMILPVGSAGGKLLGPSSGRRFPVTLSRRT